MDEAKRELVREWMKKAASDLGSAQKLASDPDPYFDTALFHCQQAAEKAVKAFLVFQDQPFEKVHDISRLIGIALPYNAQLETIYEQAELLTPYAVSLRYPDENLEPDRSDFELALEAAQKVFDLVMSLLPQTVHP